MLLRDRILAIISSTPGGVDLQTIRTQLSDVRPASVGNAVCDLAGEGALERIAHARYRVSSPRQARTALPIATSEFVRPPSLARLMAGR